MSHTYDVFVMTLNVLVQPIRHCRCETVMFQVHIIEHHDILIQSYNLYQHTKQRYTTIVTPQLRTLCR